MSIRGKSTADYPAIVVTGFMGTGKSTVGQELANMLGFEFIDTDTEIERVAGRSVSQIFSDDGEERFRQLERELCVKIADKRGVVVAAGGGTLIDDHNYDRFAGHADLVLLEATIETLVDRLDTGEDRPLLHEDGTVLRGDALRTRIQQLLSQRADQYNRITTRIDTTKSTAAETATRIATTIELPAKSLVIDPTGITGQELPLKGRYGTSRVEIGRGALSRIGASLQREGLTTHAFLLMPETTRSLYLTQIAGSLDAAGIPFSLIKVEDGDPKKDIAQTQDIIDRLIECGARRDAVVVPVGGGVTGDIGGFAASLFMRGVPLVQVPTTLLAQVDSGIGGKVGVNHPLAKNLIGAFYQPHVVINDPCTLRTLPLEEVSNGMAEVIKAALIGSRPFFEYLEETTCNAQERYTDIEFLETCVVEAARIKCDIVNEDPYEKDRRRELNLGHTVGHALEASAKYHGLKHGQAVSLGLIAAFQIAVDRGVTDETTMARVRSVLDCCGLPVTLDSFDHDAVVRSLKLDKKIRNNRLHFILPTGVGSCQVVDDVAVDEIISAMKRGLS